MISYKKGDVVLMEFIYSEGHGYKKRPALIISNNKYNSKRQEIIVAAITGNISRDFIGETKLKNWEDAGLLKPSVVTSILQTLKKDLVCKKLGALTESDLKRVEINIGKIF